MECSNRGRSDTSLSLKQETSVPDSDERDGILMHPIGNTINYIQILKMLSYGTERDFGTIFNVSTNGHISSIIIPS